MHGNGHMAKMPKKERQPYNADNKAKNKKWQRQTDKREIN